MSMNLSYLQRGVLLARTSAVLHDLDVQLVRRSVLPLTWDERLPVPRYLQHWEPVPNLLVALVAEVSALLQL